MFYLTSAAKSYRGSQIVKWLKQNGLKVDQVNLETISGVSIITGLKKN
jgi:hypothetical protein